MSLKQWLPLIGITVCVFIVNMSEFMPIGLLTDIATDLSVSDSKAGLLISAYAWAVAILSLPIMLVLRKMEFKRMLLTCISLFIVFQVVSGMAVSYGMLMIARLGVAIAHSIFWSIATPLAVSVVPNCRTKLALSMVATGTSIAMIVGLPLGRMIGLAMGWRMTFIAMALVAVVILSILIVVFPKIHNPGTFTLRRLPEIFTNKVLIGTYVVLAIYVTGYYTGYSYIEPFLARVAGFNESSITLVLTVFGLAGILGSVIFTKVYDKTRFTFMMMTLVGAATCLILLRVSSISVYSMFFLCAVWGMFATCFNVTFQNETLRASPSDATAITMALFSGIFNVGIAMGSIIGGMVTDSFSVDYIGVTGAAFVILAAIIVGAYLIRRIKENESSNFQEASIH